MAAILPEPSADLLQRLGTQRFSTILADPPWQFANRTGTMAPEHKRLNRYGTLGLADILALPVPNLLAEAAHLYLWVPNALLLEGLKVMEAWGFKYKTNIVWHKIRIGSESTSAGPRLGPKVLMSRGPDFLRGNPIS